MSLVQLGSAAVRGALGRSFLLEKLPNGIPKTVIIFDVVNEETPEYNADVTMMPTEEGEELTDHIQLKNPTLKLEGRISQTPIDLEVQALNIASGGLEALTNPASRSNFLDSGINAIGGSIGASLLGRGEAEDPLSGLTDGIARTALLTAYEKRGRFTIVTKRKQYENMVISSMKFPYNKTTGLALDFVISFQQIRIAKPFSVDLKSVGNSVVSSATSEVKQGSKVTNAVSSAKEGKLQSSAFKLLF